MTDVKLGCQLPQDNPNIEHTFEVARECESLGYDSVWAYDHLAPYWLESRNSLECWSLLSAVAARTSRIKVGTLVTNVNFRKPSLLAKMASTLDNISGGRLIVGLGIGDRLSVPELHSYGYRFPPLEERLELLRETIMLLRSMWTGDEVSFKGKVVNVSHAVCRPKPKQATGPPIWVGGKHPKLLDVIAELADGWNYWGLRGEQARELEMYLDAKRSELHRPQNSIVKSWAGKISKIRSDNNELTENMKEQLKPQIGEGTRYFIVSLPDGSNRRAYECFAEAVRAIT